MPELPEVEIIKRSLSKIVNNTKIVDIKVFNKKLRYRIPNNFSKNLVNQKILNISRRSKYLILYFKKKILLVHLGMTGKILLIRNRDKSLFKTSFYYDLNIDPKHNHIYFELSNGFGIIYNDVRKFGFFKLYSKININKIPFLNKLGYEPFSKLFNVKYFYEFIKNKKKNIKNLLMDQTFVSGLGNIYVNEALFLSRIHPLRSCASLKNNELQNLILNIKKILRLSIIKGGSSIKDFKNSYGKSGSYQQLFSVYGKDGVKCSRISCTGKIRKLSISNRSSFYCNSCQN
jgi:formamidopyrimidine-DNA glycosylase